MCRICLREMDLLSVSPPSIPLHPSPHSLGVLALLSFWNR